MMNLNDTLLLITEAFDLFPDAIIIVDSKGIIRNANKQILPILGYTESELKGKEMDILLPERFRKHHSKFVTSFFNNTSIRKMGVGVPLYGLNKAGEEIVIDIALSVVESSNEKFALAVIRDISDKMSLVNQISKMEKIKAELEQFAYILTHDLKAPLQKVKALAHLIHLELSDKGSVDIQTMINYLNESVQNMEDLIHGVLDYHKAKLSKGTVDEDVNLDEVYKQAVKLVTIPQNFTITPQNHFPVIKGNNTMMLQVFLNLIANAIHYNNKENGQLQISCIEDAEKWEFSFADNGTSIPIEQREKIFEITAQLGKSQNTHGLGLPIVKQIIENNQSNKIWCEDSTLGGSCFKFTWHKKKQ